MQWAARLIAVPLGKSNLERTLACERRHALAEGYMLPLMGVLVWTILLSIGFFVIGFLIQLWELALSFNKRAPILDFGGFCATGLSLVILGIILITTFHAAIHNNSPFESPLSHAIRPLIRWICQHVCQQEVDVVGRDKEVDDSMEGWNENKAQTAERTWTTWLL